MKTLLMLTLLLSTPAVAHASLDSLAALARAAADSTAGPLSFAPVSDSDDYDYTRHRLLGGACLSAIALSVRT